VVVDETNLYRHYVSIPGPNHQTKIGLITEPFSMLYTASATSVAGNILTSLSKGNLPSLYHWIILGMKSLEVAPPSQLPSIIARLDMRANTLILKLVVGSREIPICICLPR